MNFKFFKEEEPPKGTLKAITCGISIYNSLKDLVLTCDSYEKYTGLREKNRVLNSSDKKTVALFLGVLKTNEVFAQNFAEYNVTYQKIIEYLKIEDLEVIELPNKEIEKLFNKDFEYIMNQVCRQGLITSHNNIKKLYLKTFTRQLCNSYSTDSNIINDIYTGSGYITATSAFEHNTIKEKTSKVIYLNDYRRRAKGR